MWIPIIKIRRSHGIIECQLNNTLFSVVTTVAMQIDNCQVLFYITKFWYHKKQAKQHKTWAYYFGSYGITINTVAETPNCTLQAQNIAITVRWRLESVTNHDDVIKWKHFPRYWPFMRGIHRWPLDFPHKGQWRRALVISLICAWANHRNAGDLRHHRTHCYAIVMFD